MFRPTAKKNIFDSIRANDLSAVKKYLEENKHRRQMLTIKDTGYSRNSVYNNYTRNLAAYDTLLLCAVKEGVDDRTDSDINLQIIALLLAHEAIRFNIESEDIYDHNALTIAISNNKKYIVELLLDAKPDLTIQDPTNKLTALSWAAKKNALDMVMLIERHLLKYPDSAIANKLISIKDNEDATALDYAIKHRNAQMMSVLDTLAEKVLIEEQLQNQSNLLTLIHYRDRSTYTGTLPKDIQEIVVEFAANHEFRRVR